MHCVFYKNIGMKYQKNILTKQQIYCIIFFQKAGLFEVRLSISTKGDCNYDEEDADVMY